MDVTNVRRGTHLKAVPLNFNHDEAPHSSNIEQALLRMGGFNTGSTIHQDTSHTLSKDGLVIMLDG